MGKMELEQRFSLTRQDSLSGSELIAFITIFILLTETSFLAGTSPVKGWARSCSSSISIFKVGSATLRQSIKNFFISFLCLPRLYYLKTVSLSVSYALLDHRQEDGDF
jgi:hypothetical protein